MLAAYDFERNPSSEGPQLKSPGFFSQLSEPTLRAFEQIKFTASYPQGTLLFSEGEDPRGVFVLREGHAKLLLSSSEGKTLILRLATPGEILGLNETILGKPYIATAEALRACQVSFVRRSDFLRFLNEHVDACMTAAQTSKPNVSQRLRANPHARPSSSALEKLARLLLELSASGEETEHGTRFEVGLTHEEIAQIIGTSRETVTRTLTHFRTKHLAALRGSTCHSDKAALEHLVAA
jgi:CRP/FNR family transcriptional regulator